MKGFHSRQVTVLDQVVSSASNFALVAITAHVSAPAAFGQFSLAYVVVIFFLGLQRAAIGEVLLVRFSKDDHAPGTFAAPVGLAVVIGVAGLVVLAGGSLLSTRAPLVWLVLGAAMPVVLLQDAIRYVFICRRTSGYAFVLDAVWAVLGIGAMLVLAATGASNIAVIAAWVGGAAVSAVLGLAMTRRRPRPVAGVRWLADHRDLAFRFSAEYASLNASTALVWFALAGPLGSVGVGALRGASLLFSPLNTAFNAVRIAMIPDLVRSRGTARYRSSLATVGAVLLALALGWGVTVLLLPDRIGRLLIGSTWDAAEGLRLPNLVQALAMVGYTVLLSYFRSSELHTMSSVMRGVLAAATLAVPFVAALLIGTAGGAWGFAIAVAASAVTGLVLVGRARGDQPGGGGGMTDIARGPRVAAPEPVERSPLLGTVLGFATFFALGLVVSFLILQLPDSGRSQAWPVTFAIMLLSATRLSMIVAAGQRRMFEFIYWLFCYVFFGMAPTVQMRLDDMPGTTPDIDPVLDLPSALLALGGILGIGLGFVIANVRATRRAGGELPAREWTYELNRPGLMALTAAALLLSAYYVLKVGPSTLVGSRDGASTIEDLLWPDPSVAGIVRATSSFPILIAAHGWWSLSRRVGWSRPAKLVALVLTGITMAVTNPISSSRYASGVVWGSFVGPAGAYRTARRMTGTMVGIIAGLLFLFPLADFFRRVNTVSVTRKGFLTEYAGNGDYDAFAQLSNALLYSQTVPLQFGRQLSGQILFFVPRSIWADKPTGTGSLLAQFRGYRFTNLSSPIWAELLLNFGVIGVLIGSFLIGLGLGRLDEAFSRPTQSSTVVITSAVLPFYLLIVLRGSLLQATGSLVVIIASLLVISRRTRTVRGP